MTTRTTKSLELPVGTSYHISKPFELNDVQQAGLTAIELTWQGHDIFEESTRSRCEAIVQDAREQGIRVPSAHIPYGNEWDPSQLVGKEKESLIQAVSDIAKIIQGWGATMAIFHPSFEPISVGERSERLHRAQQTIAEMADEMHRYGVRLAIECLPRTCLGNTSGEIKQLIGRSANVGVCCDVNHLFHETPAQFIRRLGDRIITTHISDNDGNDEKHWLPGDGRIDWADVCQALHDINYSGMFMYETRLAPPRKIRESVQRLNVTMIT